MGQVVRLLIIAIAVWVAWQLIRRIFLPPPPERRATPQTAPRMLPCARCGVHVPENHALVRAGKAYCCKEHVPDTPTE